MKYFIIEWYKKEKYKEPIIRHTRVQSIDMKTQFTLLEISLAL